MQQQTPALPLEYTCYEKYFHLLWHNRSIFRRLIFDWHICIRCILKLHAIQSPKIYSHTSFYLELIVRLTDQSVLNSYNVLSYCLGQHCWLCQGIFHESYLKNIISCILFEIDKKGYKQLKQYKLNVRIPHIISLRYTIFIRYLYQIILNNPDTYKLNQKQNYERYIISTIQNNNNNVLQMKVIIKWIISNKLNQYSQIVSKIQQDQNTLIISIDLEYLQLNNQIYLMKIFQSLFKIQKKNNKKKKNQKIQLQKQQFINVQINNNNSKEEQKYICLAKNMNKIIQLNQNQFEQFIKPILQQQKFNNLMQINNKNKEIKKIISYKIYLNRKNIYLCGRYIKYSRYLSQTPWIINGNRLTQSSLQQQIENIIFNLFYPNKIKQQIQIKFHSGGRQDVDVRMLMGGRPFVLEFVNPIKKISDISILNVKKLLNNNNNQNSLIQSILINDNQNHSNKICQLLEKVVNENSTVVQIRDFRQTNESYIRKQLKHAQIEKVKYYICYVYCPEGFIQSDCKLINQLPSLKLQQKTPLRVLHRRTLMTRIKYLHKLRMRLVTVHSAVVQIWASAGTYIKQFIHGDLNRTIPHLGTILNKKSVDILQLDVGSLKEGVWSQGSQNTMETIKFQWIQ